MANKGVMVVAAGALGLGAFLLFRKKAEAAPPVPEDDVGVMLRNIPSEATMWQLAIYDWDEVSHISKFGMGIEEQAIFTIPPGWAFPLRVDILIYTLPAVVYYRMHSTENIFPEFYREAFIPEYGGYYYNVSKERFE